MKLISETYLIILVCASVTLSYSVQQPPDYDIWSLPSEIQNLYFSLLPANENLSLSRTCKAFRNLAIRTIMSRPVESIVELLPSWFASKPGSREHESMKSLLTCLLSSLKTGEPEDIMVEIISTELFENHSEDYLIACDNYPGIVNEIIKGTKSSKDNLPGPRPPDALTI